MKGSLRSYCTWIRQRVTLIRGGHYFHWILIIIVLNRVLLIKYRPLIPFHFRFIHFHTCSKTWFHWKMLSLYFCWSLIEALPILLDLIRSIVNQATNNRWWILWLSLSQRWRTLRSLIANRVHCLLITSFSRQRYKLLISRLGCVQSYRGCLAHLFIFLDCI